MPIVMGVDHEIQQVDAVAIGAISFADVENHLQSVKHFRGLAYKEFLEARGASFAWTQADALKIVELVESLSRESVFGPTAVLVSNDSAFGMIRVLEILLEGTAEVRPFRDESEARLWLLQPVGPKL